MVRERVQGADSDRRHGSRLLRRSAARPTQTRLPGSLDASLVSRRLQVGKPLRMHADTCRSIMHSPGHHSATGSPQWPVSAASATFPGRHGTGSVSVRTSRHGRPAIRRASDRRGGHTAEAAAITGVKEAIRSTAESRMLRAPAEVCRVRRRVNARAIASLPTRCSHPYGALIRRRPSTDVAASRRPRSSPRRRVARSRRFPARCTPPAQPRRGGTARVAARTPRSPCSARPKCRW